MASKLGIVIPTINRKGEYFQKCLRSLSMSDTDKDIIFIVIDNSKNNRLVNRSWNEGLDIAVRNKCDFVAFVNDDIEVSIGWWTTMEGIFEEHPEIWCLSPKYTSGEMPADFQAQAVTRFINNQNSRIEPLASGFFFVVRMSAFEELRQQDGIFGFCRDYDGGLWYEDRDFWERLNKVGHPAMRAKNVLIHHYESRTLNTLSKDKLNKLKENNLKAFMRRWNYNPNQK